MHSMVSIDGPKHKSQRLSESAAPVIFVVRMSFEVQAQPLFAVEFVAQNPVGFLLPLRVQAVQGLIAAVEIDMAVCPPQG